MWEKMISGYFAVPLIYRIVTAFILGIAAGILCSRLTTVYGEGVAECVTGVLAPFGTVLIAMLKMVVIPIIFFSLVTGAASLPLKQFGKLGLMVVVWYFLTSVFAAAFGTGLAYLMNPAMETDASLSGSLLSQAGNMKAGAAGGPSFLQFLNDLFMNPFQALAEGKFLPIIVFSILFGLAARTVIEKHGAKQPMSGAVEKLLEILDAALHVSYQIIDWVMEYFPVGVFALTTVNFTLYGPELFGPYLQIARCVVLGVLLMIFLIYPLLVLILCRENPYRLLNKLKEPIITAFLTRSSAATLPISLRTAGELRVRPELSGFALPLGATVNMDGACIHLPVFAVLAVNMFGLPFGIFQILFLIFSVVLASIGAGGIPGGSIFLLFLVLTNLGLPDAQVAMVVALAIGINPLLDMFETACNVTGDNICNYIVARRGGMMESPEK